MGLLMINNEWIFHEINQPWISGGVHRLGFLKWMVYFMENLNLNRMMTGVPLFQETSIEMI